LTRSVLTRKVKIEQPELDDTPTVNDNIIENNNDVKINSDDNLVQKSDDIKINSDNINYEDLEYIIIIHTVFIYINFHNES